MTVLTDFDNFCSDYELYLYSFNIYLNKGAGVSYVKGTGFVDALGQKVSYNYLFRKGQKFEFETYLTTYVKAQDEIKDLVFANNNNSNRVIEYVNKKINTLINNADIIKQLITETNQIIIDNKITEHGLINYESYLQSVNFIFKFAEWLEKFNLKSQKFIKKKPVLKYTTFSHLFETPEIMEQCIQVLKDIEPPVLSKTNKILNRKGGAVATWFQLSQDIGIMKKCDNKTFAEIFSKTFSPISRATLGRRYTILEMDYKDILKDKLNKISLQPLQPVAE